MPSGEKCDLSGARQARLSNSENAEIVGFSLTIDYLVVFQNGAKNRKNICER